MGLFKPKGKHAQKTGSQPKDTWQQIAEENGLYDQPLASQPADETAMLDAVDEAASPDSADVTRALDPVNETPAPAGSQFAVSSAQVPAAEVPAIGAPQPMPEPAGSFAPADSFAPMASAEFAAPKKRRVGKVVGITFGVIIGVLLVAYIAGAVVFMNWFLPRTSIVGNDISMKSNAEVAEMLDNAVDKYSLKVAGTGFNYETTAADLGLTVDSQQVVDAMHADLNPWTWPVLIFQDSHDESSKLDVSCKQQAYRTQVTDAINAFNKEATPPTDATISYDEQTKKFKVVPEVQGTQYDTSAVLAAMDDAIASLQTNVSLTSDQLIQPKVFSTDERLVNSAEMATGLVSAHVTLALGGQNVMEINGDNLSRFIRLDENMGAKLDEGAFDQWVNDISNSFNTVGSERTYTRPDGKVITISGGAYGWSTDTAGLKDQVVAAVKAGQTTTIDIPCDQYAAAYNGPGKPDWGNRYIDVDLSEQYVRFYGDDGSIIWESACISGSPDGEHNTWPGVWYITNKQSPSKLIGYLPSGEKEYETTVSFWMAFEGNGIGLHDATWQPSFGGSMYANGYGSHGCVNLPYDAAASLYDISAVGDCVIAHY